MMMSGMSVGGVGMTGASGMIAGMSGGAAAAGVSGATGATGGAEVAGSANPVATTQTQAQTQTDPMASAYEQADRMLAAGDPSLQNNEFLRYVMAMILMAANKPSEDDDDQKSSVGAMALMMLMNNQLDQFTMGPAQMPDQMVQPAAASQAYASTASAGGGMMGATGAMAGGMSVMA